ncbi:putative bifunctional diguanylate cyclase/phosphodiesterase [Microvirga sp. GCM10011540]|uniref:putative bifunctional diguanylate cyclase/phosphodiesterase n=1 Tax=Microvirga sp. GCM10011540 TaxID=3317338 RepID=UPI003619DB23
MAIILLFGLTGFHCFRGLLGLSLGPLFGINAAVSRWSAEMALLLLMYAPALAFVFLSMAKERVQFDHENTEQARRESEEHYRYSVELNPQIPWTADPQGFILDVSHRWCDLMGMSVEQALGQGWIRALHPDDVPFTTEQWSKALTTRRPVDVEYRLRLTNGSYRWFRARAAPRFGENGAVLRWYGTVEDIHDKKVAEERLQWAAHHDDLTGLPNRRLFRQCLQQALEQATSSQATVGLLMMDLDNLKTINDRFGHDVGDALLREFAERLRSLVRTTDAVARLGGDEFAIILNDVPGEDYVAATASSVLTRMQEPLRYNGRTLDCRTSIGGAIAAGPVVGTEELQKQADLALYHCKANGRGTFRMFAPDMREEAQKTASALEVARNVVTSDWIVPFYQPKVDLVSGKLDGFEALLRWRHPRTGIHTPATIAPAFDDTELGRAIGARMLSCVVKDVRGWLDAGLEVGRIAINASTAEFRNGGYAERMLEELARAGVPTACLEVEVTESVFLGRSAEFVERALQALSGAGVTIALDDFGTGYASLTHLKQFPVDVIKLDHSFIRNMETDASDAAIVQAMLSLSQSLGIRVVAEGVETPTQASLLREQGCNLGQGHHFGRPMPAKDIPQCMRLWMRSAPEKASERLQEIQRQH